MIDFEVGINGMAATFQAIGPNTTIERFGNVGATIKDTVENWAHIAISTPIRIDDKSMNIDSIWLQYNTGAGAWIDRIVVFDGQRKIFDERITLRGDGQLDKKITSQRIWLNILISAHLVFSADSPAYITFKGAGVRLNKGVPV